MKFSLLLFALSIILKRASRKSADYQKHIAGISARVIIKTADGGRARLFRFDRGVVTSRAGDHGRFDVALIWKDAETGFSVMTDKNGSASFNAAADGKLKVEGMSVFAQWFEEGVKLVL